MKLDGPAILLQKNELTNPSVSAPEPERFTEADGNVIV